ncbi:MAG: DUF434 domain-containing protein [Spirochaetaceae bacterium]|nr:DUF434 domain-containing protein [Spirochaetaceae bacterium]
MSGGWGEGAAFAEAVRDYRWLLDRGYPDKASLKLVGDRRRLEAAERLVLFRGVASAEASRRRVARLVAGAAGRLVLLDGYNVAFTVLHYLVGKPCFVGTDGLLRDAGANYGRVPREGLLERAFAELGEALAAEGVAAVEAWLDAPVSGSAGHAAVLAKALEGKGFASRVALARSADGAILARLEELGMRSARNRPAENRAGEGAGDGAGASREAAADPGWAPLVASSDSAVADRSPAVFDLARRLLERRYGAAFRDLGELAGGADGP